MFFVIYVWYSQDQVAPAETRALQKGELRESYANFPIQVAFICLT